MIFFAIPTTNLGWDIWICKYHLLFASSLVQSLFGIITRKLRAKGTDILGPKRRKGITGFQHKSHLEVDRMWFVELKGRGIKN